MSVPFLPLPKQSNLIFLSACAALSWTTGQCPLPLENLKMAGGPCHVHGRPILMTPETTAHMQVVGTLPEQPIHLQCWVVFCYFT